MTRRYRIEHRTKYTYSDDVTTSFGRVYLHPRDTKVNAAWTTPCGLIHHRRMFRTGWTFTAITAPTFT